MAGLDEFIQNFQETMTPEEQQRVKKYIQEMLEACVDDDGRKSACVTFQYPARGGQNDGNPALKAILSILPRKKLVVKENPYTAARAIWLCEDFKVTFNQKKSKVILTQALNALN